MHKVALGTAQFGMNYGINNKRGKIPKKEVFEILTEALKSGIDTLDTAYSYGESEAVIGEYIKKYKKKIKIVSKLPKCNPKEVKNIFHFSVKRLNGSSLYGYMIHSFQNYVENSKIWNIMEQLKSDGKIEKIGFSIYFPNEVEYFLKNNIKIDIIQIPYSIFDQRFAEYLPELKNKDVEIYARSVFLQGLVFKHPDRLNDYFVKIKKKIENLNSLSIKLNIPIASICINFAVLNKFIDKVVVGVDSIENLKEIIRSPNYLNDVENILPMLSGFKVDDEKIILPLNWNKKNEHTIK